MQTCSSMLQFKCHFTTQNLENLIKLEIGIVLESTLNQQRTVLSYSEVLDFTFIPWLIFSPLSSVLPKSDSGQLYFCFCY